ncbi:MAG: preprotein translocase subunit YajC [Ruminococcus sp.]|nr:preprotein translocase subunit YajC [Ruminococcus sp.]
MNFIAKLATSNGSASVTDMLITFIPLIVIVFFFYFFIIRPQRKQDKKDAAMREHLEIGDEVVTNGGIVGIVFSVKDDTVVIETGGDRSKIRVMKWAIAKNLTVHDD